MPMVSGLVGTLAVAVLAVAGLVTWLLRDRRHPGPRLIGHWPLIDRNELEAAEREVRDPAHPPPDQPVAGRDWRPGVPRPPERL